jgi:hypothetical protein
MQLDAPFPLTPALSPRERENHLAAEYPINVQSLRETAEKGSLSLGRGPG